MTHCRSWTRSPSARRIEGKATVVIGPSTKLKERDRAQQRQRQLAAMGPSSDCGRARWIVVVDMKLPPKLKTEGVMRPEAIGSSARPKSAGPVWKCWPGTVRCRLMPSSRWRVLGACVRRVVRGIARARSCAAARSRSSIRARASAPAARRSSRLPRRAVPPGVEQHLLERILMTYLGICLKHMTKLRRLSSAASVASSRPAD